MPRPAKFFDSKTRLRLLVLAFVTTVSCVSTTITFTQAKDDSVMQELESTWSNSGPQMDTVELSLCEDRDMSDNWDTPGDCQEAHVVRGHQRAIEHKEQEPSGVGCGGCPFMVLAYVKGTIHGGPFDQTVEVSGSVNMGDLHDVDSIYHYPYHVDLLCDGEQAACKYINGELYEDGHMELGITKDSSSENIELNLSRQGPSACELTDN